MVAPVRDLCGLAVDAALGAGASYADARVVVRRSQRVSVKDGRGDAVDDVETEGSEVEQEIVECGGGIEATAVRDRLTQTRTYPTSHGGSSAQAGWEHVEALRLERE